MDFPSYSPFEWWCRIFWLQISALLESFLLFITAITSLLLLRLYTMGYKPPDFSPSDNPAADSDSLLTRTLTFFYLPLFNMMLLTVPVTLSFDWSMGAIPLVESVADPRFAASLLFYAVVGYILKHSLTYFLTYQSSNYQETGKLHPDSPRLTLRSPMIHSNGHTKSALGDNLLHRRHRRDSNSSSESTW